MLGHDVPPLEDMEAEKAWLQTKALADVAYDLLYINGESALPGSDVLAIEPDVQAADVRGNSLRRRPVTDNTSRRRCWPTSAA